MHAWVININSVYIHSNRNLRVRFPEYGQIEN